MKKINFYKLQKTFITAEVGINHNGSEKKAFQLLNAASKVGADAIKLQTFKTEDYISKDEKKRFNRTKKFELTRDFFNKIFSFSRKKGLLLYTTPFGINDLDFIKNKTSIIKIASGELTYHELIYKSALTKKPIILSTGLGTINEIESAINLVYKANPKAKKNGKLMLLHCIAGYPTPSIDTNLNTISFLKERFDLPVGFSDHTLENETSIYAVLAGAIAIEKHFTLNSKDRSIRDHSLSFEPDQFKILVKKIREAEVILGKRNKNIRKSEKNNFQYLRRSVAALVDIPADKIIQRRHLTALRPLSGIPIEKIDKVLGKKLKVSLQKGQIIKTKHLKQT